MASYLLFDLENYLLSDKLIDNFIKTYMKDVFVADHPYLKSLLKVLRDKNTKSSEFRRNVSKLTTFLLFEATKDINTKEIEIDTPLTKTTGTVLTDRIALVPILRAGLGMCNAVTEILEDAEVWYLGMYRDEKTLKPVSYYNKLPKESPPDIAILLDPMLATGGTLVAAIEEVKKWGVQKVKVISVIASPEGIAKVQEADPSVELYLGALDERLTKDDPNWPDGFIWPGLGDAGDRLNCTY